MTVDRACFTVLRSERMRDVTGSGPSWPELRDFVSYPCVVELIDLLSHSPVTLAEIGANIAARRRRVVSALRFAAAHGLVGTRDGGSWDDTAPKNALYILTDSGRQLLDTLSREARWASLFDIDQTEPTCRVAGIVGSVDDRWDDGLP